MAHRNYKYLLFDVDDTLLDFGANESESLRKLFEYHGYPLTDELLRTYHTINKQFWVDYEQGKVAMDEMLSQRFTLTMAQFGVAVNGEAWEQRYQALLGSGLHLIDDAPQVCGRLSRFYSMFVITNGVRETQHKRLKAAGLFDCFEDIFNSQSIGYQKPSKEFFDHVAAHIEGFDASEALIIGDSPYTDIKGGIEAGIDTCWFNRHRCEADIASTYTITKLTELFDILGITHEE